MIYGFTGDRNIEGVPEEIVTDVLRKLGHAAGFVTGAAVGIDTYVGLWLYKRYVLADHYVIVPANKSRICEWWINCPAVRVIQMPSWTSYKDRNQEIVNRCDRMIGFPGYAESDGHSRRSGTWQTIRMARRINKLDSVHLLRGV